MTLYHREGNHAKQISFDPEKYRELAKQAVNDVVGELGKTITISEAQNVQERWQELIEQNTSDTTS